jgi:hypothetical protein
MRTTPKTGAQHCHALDAWLRGEVAAPEPGESVVATLRFLVIERLGGLYCRARELVRNGLVDDPALAWAWASACSIVADFERGKRGRRAYDEQTVLVRMQTLHKHCTARIDSIGSQDVKELMDDEVAAVFQDYRLLAGNLSLSLMELGDFTGRRDVRECAAEHLEETDGPHVADYARVLLGLSGDVGEPWRAGQGAKGALKDALADGQKVLLGAMPSVLKEDAETVRFLRVSPQDARLRDLATSKPEPSALPDLSGPSLLVLRTVEHLPGGAEDGKSKPGRSTAASARGEFGPIASRRLRLVTVPDLAQARETLVAEFPDDASVIDAILVPLAGRSYVLIPPTLLLGPPGTGKSRFTRRLGQVLGLAVTVYGCGGVADASLIGTSRQWSTGRACVPLQSIKAAEEASVMIVLDEISRAGTRQDNGRLVDGVLALTETETARAYHDPYVECPVDLSAVSWLATANSTAGLDPALLSRFRVLTMGARTVASLPSLVVGIMGDIRSERGLDATWLPSLDEEELAILAEHWPGGSVRTLRRLVESVLASREHFATRM